MRIIGLTGKARSGKDTVAGMIEGLSFTKDFTCVQTYALAWPLKKAASIAFGIPFENFNHADKKEIPDEYWGISPREIAQKFGTECMRNVFDEDFWLKRMEMELTKCSDDVIFVITDIRFENEADWVREHGGEIWHISRPSLGGGVVRSHASEAGVEIKDEDKFILNNSSLLYLEIQVEDIL